MIDLYKRIMKKIKLFVLFWTRIVFVRNNFRCSFFTKLRSNFSGGYLADQSVLYDFRHNSRKDYLSEFDWYRSRYINEPFDYAFNNKVVCTEILRPLIRVAENYFIKNKGIVLDYSKGARTYEDIYDCIVRNSRVIIKPFALGKGNGVNMLSVRDGKHFIDDRECSREDIFDILEKRDSYMICEFMEQHGYSDAIYDRTVNTIRFITMRDTETHDFRIFFAVQRIGTSQTIPVDNGSKGGLISKIDLETGELSEARSLKDLRTFKVHPDSGNPIEGVRIPGWQQIKEQMLDVCRKIPFMDFIAWDLLITEDEVCVIEANTSSGVNIIQLWGGQRNGELGDFFRHYKILK